MHYPDCWDTAAYPTLDSAMLESLNSFMCSTCAEKIPAQPAAAPASANETGSEVVVKTGDRLTDMKANDIIRRDGYKLTGAVLCKEDGSRCIVESSAVRWLTKDEAWALMRTSDVATVKAATPIHLGTSDPEYYRQVIIDHEADLAAHADHISQAGKMVVATAPADERAALDVALAELNDYQRKWDTGTPMPYAQSERIAMECACEAVRDALEEARAAASPTAEAVRLTDEQRRVLVEVAQMFKGTDLRRAVLNELAGIAATPQPAQADAPADVTPIPYDGLTEEFTDEVARLANDAPGIREAVAGALESCGAIIAPADALAEAREPVTRESMLAAIDEFELVCDNNLARDLSPDEKFAVSEFVIGFFENAPAIASASDGKPITYVSTQATNCARCGQHKHTPLRIDWMGGYVCLTCIDRELESRSPALAAEAAASPAAEEEVIPVIMYNGDAKRNPALRELLNRQALRHVLSNPRGEESPQPAQADAPAEAREPHSDDVAVDSFAAVIKHKLALARDKGRGGWETCSPTDLSRMLREHVEKGDPRDVANFCMMLWHHGSPIVSAPADAGDAPPFGWAQPKGGNYFTRDVPRHWNPVYNTDPIQRACAELPEGWEINVCMERDAGGIDIYDPAGQKLDFDSDADHFDWRIHEAIDAARSGGSR
ncbi:hypothetical protein WS71_20225 [Burkholderia mayonis]|uniref:Uncharacterized protein n=1 Tax=Burkholderia mayonis TaxID=1385591 RepID=A0A1B4G139_9BURK|nr:hypothetical protein WS71_20225 [Burkholderia mayonis]